MSLPASTSAPGRGPDLIAVDWGTSALRAARLDADGTAREERSSGQGILNVAAGAFPATLEALCGDWLGVPGSLCLMSGMVGSRQGWREAPYRACPAGFDDLAGALLWLEPGRMAIVPGLQCEHDGVPDVMRGEEIQVFGALDLLGLQDATLVLPGTHSKWVRARGRRVLGFQTLMTGEVYALLRHQSILSRMMPPDDSALDDAAFDAGVARALASPGLLATAFSARTLALFDRMPADSLSSWLSGLVIGEELRAQRAMLEPGDPLVVVGSSTLAARYERALRSLGITPVCVGAQATWRGLRALSRSLDAGS